MPGADQAIRAASQSGWEAVTLVVVVLGICGLFAWMIRGDKQELRELHRFVRGTMADIIDDNTVGWARIAQTLRARPCLHDSDAADLSDGNGTKVTVDDIPDLDTTARRAVERRQRRKEQREGG